MYGDAADCVVDDVVEDPDCGAIETWMITVCASADVGFICRGHGYSLWRDGRPWTGQPRLLHRLQPQRVDRNRVLNGQR